MVDIWFDSAASGGTCVFFHPTLNLSEIDLNQNAVQNAGRDPNSYGRTALGPAPESGTL
jgi:hypothetical protein